MKILFKIIIVLSIAMQISCAVNRMPTLKNLSDRDLVVDKNKIEKVSESDVLQSYHEYLEVAPANHPMYKNALNRLADMEMVAGDNKLLAETESQYQQALQVASATTQDQGQKNYENAINLYQGLLDSNPDDARNDWVFYQLASAYEKTGQLEESLRVLSLLVEQYPKSEYYAEAQFRRGDINFTLKEFLQAEKAFFVVIRLGNASVYYEKAIYKYAWSKFKQDLYNEALMGFFQIIKILPVVYDLQEKIDTRALSKIEKDLLEDVFRAISLCVSYGGGVDYLNSIFQKSAPMPFEFEVFRHVGQYYIDHDRIKDAADTYGVFVQRQPYHPMSSSLQIRRIRAYDQGRFGRAALSAREDFIKKFGIGTSFWLKQNTSTRAILRIQVKSVLNDLSEFYHARLQRNRRNKEYFTKAIFWYKQYIVMFPGDVEVGRKHFLLGELYSEKKQYLNAAKAYESAAFDYEYSDYQKEAAYAAIDSYIKATKHRKKSVRKNAKNKLIQASRKFVDFFPGDTRALAVRARLVEGLFRQKQYDDAVIYANFIAALNKEELGVDINFRKFSYYQMSANVVLGHIAFEREDYLLAQGKYQQALSLKIRNRKLLGVVNKRLAAASYKYAESLQKNGDLLAAAEGFLRVNAVAPQSKISIQAQYDAATAYFNLQKWQQSIEILERFRLQNPNSKYEEKITDKLAVAYEKSGLYAKAAREILMIASSTKKYSVRRDATWKAAEFYEKANRRKLAIKTYKHYVRKYTKPFELMLEGKHKILGLYAETGQQKKRDYWIKNIATAKISKKTQLTDRTKYLIASARIELADKKMSLYSKAKLALPLKRSLKKKRRLMKRALIAYESVSQIGVEEFTTASTHRVGEIYQQFGESIMRSERPSRLTVDEREEYDLLLEEQAFPFEEKAIEIYEVNIARIKNSIYDQWVKGSMNKLSFLQPVRYGKKELIDEMYSSLD